MQNFYEKTQDLRESPVGNLPKKKSQHMVLKAEFKIGSSLKCTLFLQIKLFHLVSGAVSMGSMGSAEPINFLRGGLEPINFLNERSKSCILWGTSRTYTSNK